MTWGGADGGWVTPIAPRAGRGDARARGGGGIRSPRDARAHLVRSGGAVGGVHGLVANATHLRGRLRELPGRGHGLVQIPRHVTPARVRVLLDPRSRPRVESIAWTGATGATRSEDETRSTARVQGTFRDVPPGRGWRAAARRQVNLGIAHCEPKRSLSRSVQSASRASFYRFSRSVSRAKWRERHPLVAPDRSFAKGRGEKVVDTPRSVSIVGGGGTPRRPSPARRTRRRPVRRCRARAAMARLRRVLRSRTTRSRGR